METSAALGCGDYDAEVRLRADLFLLSPLPVAELIAHVARRAFLALPRCCDDDYIANELEREDARYGAPCEPVAGQTTDHLAVFTPRAFGDAYTRFTPSPTSHLYMYESFAANVLRAAEKRQDALRPPLGVQYAITRPAIAHALLHRLGGVDGGAWARRCGERARSVQRLFSCLPEVAHAQGTYLADGFSSLEQVCNAHAPPINLSAVSEALRAGVATSHRAEILSLLAEEGPRESREPG